MNSIAIKFDENKDLTDVVNALEWACSPEKLRWIVLGIYGDIHTLEAISGIANLKQCIEGLKPFTWSEVQKLAAGDYVQEGELAAFRSEEDLENFRLSKDRQLCALFITGADYYSWRIFADDDKCLSQIKNQFADAETLSDLG